MSDNKTIDFKSQDIKKKNLDLTVTPKKPSHTAKISTFFKGLKGKALASPPSRARTSITLSAELL